MKVIDAARSGNALRFYLGVDGLDEWHGDDWDDAPWQCNAGAPYDEFVSATADFFLRWDLDAEMQGDVPGSAELSKLDLLRRGSPLVVVRPSFGAGRAASVLMGGGAEDAVRDLARYGTWLCGHCGHPLVRLAGVDLWTGRGYAFKDPAIG